MKLQNLIDGKYFLQSLVDKGELVSTYQVWHSEWDMPLLAKAALGVKPDEPQYAMLQKEGERWLELGMHPNLVSPLFLRKIDGVLWLFLESLVGESLASSAKRREGKVEEIVTIALEIANGMSYLHGDGAAHGNLSKENVWICKDGRVRLDNVRWDHWAGLKMISRGMRSHLYPNLDKLQRATIKKRVAIRLAYQPPEYFLAPIITEPMAADVYSFGVMLYELLAGSPPLFYPQEEPERLFSAYLQGHQHGRHEPLVSKCPGLPAALASAIEACLSAAPQDRPRFPQILDILKQVVVAVSGKPYVFESWDDNTLLAMSLNNRALGYIDSGQLDQAEKLLQEVSDLDNRRVAAIINLNLLRLRKGTLTVTRFHQEMQAYQIIDPRQVAWSRGKVALEYGSFILQSFEELNKVAKPDDEAIQMLKADFHYRLKEYQDTRDILRAIANEKPRSQEFWYRLGAASLALKLNSEAQQTWEFGMRTQLPLRNLVVAYSMLLAMQGQWPNARRFLDQAMQNLNGYVLSLRAYSQWSQVKRLRASDKYGVLEVAFASDRKHIFAWTKDGKSRAWDLPSCKERSDLITPTLPGSTSRTSQNLLQFDVQGAAITLDGSKGLTIHGDTMIRFWDLKKGECLRELSGHRATVTAIAISQNGKLAMSAAMDKTVRIWDLATGVCRIALPGHNEYVNCIAIAPDSTLAISGGWDKTLRVWDLLNERCVAVLEGYASDITALAFSADGRLAISGDMVPTVQIWDIPTEKRIALLEGHDAKITAVYISEDGHMALAGSADGFVYVYEDVSQRHCPCWVRASYVPEGLPTPLPMTERRQMAEQEEKMAQAMEQNQIITALQSYQLRRQHGHLGVTAEAIEPLLGTAKTQQVAAKKIVSHQLACTWVHESNIAGFVIGAAPFVFTLSEEGIMRRWNYYNGGSDIFWQKPSLLPISLDCRTNGKRRFCISGRDKMVYFWDPEVDEWIIMEGHAADIRSIRMTAYGQYAVSGSGDGTVQIWDLVKENLVNDWRAPGLMITDIAVSPDGNLAIVGSADGSFWGWELPGGKLVVQNQQKSSPILCLATPSNKSNAVFSGGLDGSIREWSLTSGLYYNIIKAFSSSVSCLQVHPNGKWLVAGSLNGQVKVWDLTTRKNLVTVDAHPAAVSKVAMSSDGMWLFTAGQDRALKVWTLDWEWA